MKQNGVQALGAVEARLLQGIWHETLARITPGVIHAVNSSLTAILLPIGILQSKQQQQFEEAANLIKEGTERASQLLRALMRIHTEEPGTTDYCDLNAVVKDTVEILGKALKHSIELALQLATEPLPTHVDAVELRKALFFLGFNAADNLSEHGKITFTTVDAADVPAVQFGNIRPKQNYVGFSVSYLGPARTWTALDSTEQPVLTGDKTGDDAELRLWAVKRFLQTAHGALAINTGGKVGNMLRVFLPKVELKG